MRPWAEWTAKTALVAAGLAAAGGVLPGAALAGTGGIVPSASTSVLGTSNVVTQRPGRDSSGAAGAGSGRSTTVGSPARALIGHVTAPLASVLRAAGPLAGLGPVSGLTSFSGVASPEMHGLRAASASASASAPGAGRTFDASSGASSGAGGAGVPDASQLVGLGTLPGLADLPSLAGLANMPALNGESGSATPMPGTRLSAANAAGLSSNSYAALAVGSLLAGASALKIAGRRARDRRRESE